MRAKAARWRSTATTPNRIARFARAIAFASAAASGRYQDIIVRIVIDQHVKKSEARALYDDVTPKPTPEEIEMRVGARLSARPRAAGTPDRRRRREIRRFKEG